MSKSLNTVRLGFEVGTGTPVDVPLAHTFVSGQTQQSGKTTTLRAIVSRSGRRALAFVTKRGEEFEGRVIRPYVPRRSAEPIHWRLVEAMLASALDQKRLQSLERLWLIKAAKGAYSLDDVQRNVRALLAKTKSDRSGDIYVLLDEYLELVVPQLRALDASATLDLAPGLNVMDLSGLSAQTQAMVMRAAFERINQVETDVLTVLPEAWEFAPNGRSAPAKDEAIAMARKGAAAKVQNFLLVDSQDVAGVDTVVRGQCSVWLLGVQRELNEIKRTLDLMPLGTGRPKAADVATLKIGQFFACWGAHVIKTYVQPAWMTEAEAIGAATGTSTPASMLIRHGQQSGSAIRTGILDHFDHSQTSEETVTHQEAEALRAENATVKSENATLRQQVTDLTRRLEALENPRDERSQGDRSDRSAARQDQSRAGKDVDAVRPAATRPQPAGAPRSQARAFTPDETFDNERLYQAFKARLIAEASTEPAILKLLQAAPEIIVTRERRTLSLDTSSLKGRVAVLIANKYLDEIRAQAEIQKELQRTGPSVHPANLMRALDGLVNDGFLTDEGRKFVAVQGMKVNIVEA